MSCQRAETIQDKNIHLNECIFLILIRCVCVGSSVRRRCFRGKPKDNAAFYSFTVGWFEMIISAIIIGSPLSRSPSVSRKVWSFFPAKTNFRFRLGITHSAKSHSHEQRYDFSFSWFNLPRINKCEANFKALSILNSYPDPESKWTK